MNIKNIFLIAALLILACSETSAQTTERQAARFNGGVKLQTQSANTVSEVDFAKTIAEEQTTFLKFIEQNWSKAPYILKEKGKASQTIDAEKAAARVPLENYLKGHETGNPEFMKKAFHTVGDLIFIRDGKYTRRSFTEYIGGMSGKPAEDESKRKRYIESVDVAGNAAIGKIILDYPTVKFVDYMTLLKIDGEWKIVNKSFYAEPKQQQAQK